MTRVQRLANKRDIQDAINCGICLLIFIAGMILYLIKFGVRV